MAEDSDNALLPRIGGGGIPAPVLVNPLAAMNQGLATAGHLWDIRGKQAQESIGQAYLDSIDPKTGRLDPLTFQQNVKAGGAVNAMGARDAAVTGEQLQTSQQKLSEAQQGQVHTAISAALLEKDDSRLSAAVLEQAQRLIDGGVPRDRVMGSLLNLSSNPPEMRRQLEVTLTGLMPPQQRQGFIYGAQGEQTGPGGNRTGYVRDARTGAITAPPQSGAPQGMDPAQIAEYQRWLKSPRDYPDPADPTVTKHGTNETFQRDSGVPEKFIYPGGAPATPGTQPSPLGTGRPPAALLNPNKPQATPAAPAPTPSPATPATPAPVPSPAGTGISGPTPAQAAAAAATRTAQEATGTASAGKFQAIVDQGVKARSQDAMLATLLSEAQNYRTGPGADTVNQVKRTILGLGAQFGTTFGIDEKKLAAHEDVVKIGNQLADAQGAGSDARLHVSEGANPSYHNTPAGMDLIVRQLRGNNDYLRVRQQLAAAYPDKDKIEDFEAKIGANLDPRVFQYERLKPEQRADYYNGLTDKAAFRKAHDWAAGQKLLGGGG